MPSNEATEEEDNSNDIIPSVLHGSPFKLRPDEEKYTILKIGRPIPKLNINKRDSSKNCNRTFQTSWYGIHRWLCGSKSYNKLFCWPCTLMRPETSTWCSIGNDDIKRFTALAAKHAICKSHLKAISEYDETLTNFDLPPEFVNELNFTCKDNEDLTDQEDDDFFFKDDSKSKKSRANSSENKESSEMSKSKTKITFKTWQEMYKDTFPLSSTKFAEDQKLFKNRRKLVRQELKNARLTGEKLKLEMEVLKAKAQYYKSLNENSIKCEVYPDDGCLKIDSQQKTAANLQK